MNEIHPHLFLQFGSGVAIQCNFDLIFSIITTKYNFIFCSPDSIMSIYVSELLLSTSGKSTAMAIPGIGKKLQDLGDRVTVTNIDNYSNADCGLLASDKFCEIFVCNSVNYYCGRNERHLNIEQQHLTLYLGKILKYANANERNGKSFGNVLTLKNEQIVNTISPWIWNVPHLTEYQQSRN